VIYVRTNGAAVLLSDQTAAPAGSSQLYLFSIPAPTAPGWGGIDQVA
jgi:hypothetical protein